MNWKKFAGTKLEVNLTKGPRSENLQKYEKEFTDLTGIQVASEATPEQQQRQKAVIELNSGRPSFDVIHMSYHVQKRQFEKAGWLADISGFMKDPGLTEASLKESDFSSAGLRYAKDDKGRMLSLPFSVDYWIVYWNKDLFAKKNLSYPTTFEELVRTAEALTDPKEGTYGFVARGLKNANVPVWSSFLHGYGGDFLDAGGNPDHRLARGDRGGAALPAPAHQGGAAGRLRLQLVGVPVGLPAGQDRHVARRRRLRPAAGGPGQVAGGRQGRLRRDAEGAEGPRRRDLRRRHRRHRREPEQGGRLSLLPVGGVEAAGRAPAPGRRRRPVPHLGPRRRRGAQRA